MRKVIKKIAAFTVVATLGIGLLTSCGGDGDFPTRSVAVYVPFTAGGGTDLVARGIVEAARSNFPQGIAVENRTGGGGAIGLVAGATAAPTGYVVTTITVESITLPHMGGGVDLGPESFRPIIMLNEAYSVMSVNASSPFHTLDDLLAAAREDTVLVGNSGVGAIWHLAAAALGREAGVEFNHVPFEGAADALTSLLGNHIHAIPVSFPEVYAQVMAGEVRVLAVLGPERIDSIPDVPTARELGFDVVVSAWRGMGVPAGTPDDVVNRLYDIFSEAAVSNSFVNFMDSNNLSINIMNSADFARRLRQDDALFGSLIAELGIGN